MKAVKGIVRLKPIIEYRSELLNVQNKTVIQCIVTDAGEGCECKVGDKVLIRKTPVFKFENEGIDGELLVNEEKTIIGIFNESTNTIQD